MKKNLTILNIVLVVLACTSTVQAMEFNSYVSLTSVPLQGDLFYHRDPLIEAVKKESLEEAKEAIAEGSSVHCTGQFDVTNMIRLSALGFAIHYSNLDMARLLIENGADVNDDVHWGTETLSAVACAIQYALPDMLHLLIEKGADVNAIHGTAGVTFLHMAAKIGCKESVCALIDAGADMYQKDFGSIVRTDQSWNALRYAAYYNHPELCDLLVEKMLCKGIVKDSALMFLQCLNRQPEPTNLKNIFTPLVRAMFTEHREIANAVRADIDQMANADIKQRLLQKYFNHNQ